MSIRESPINALNKQIELTIKVKEVMKLIRVTKSITTTSNLANIIKTYRKQLLM